jgi:hypothetical protein
MYKKIMAVCLYNQERMILKWIIRQWDEEAWTDLAQDRYRWRAMCERGSEP